MSRRAASTLLVTWSLIVAGCGGSTPGSAAAPAPASVAPSASAAGPASAAPASASAVPTELVADIDVGGRTVRIWCAGPIEAGKPTVVLEAGFQTPANLWGDVIDGLSETHRVCAYDRAGMGQSQPATEPSRTTADLVDDLRAALDGAGIEGPFVVVGHSLGAWVAALFAERYPDEVAGLVLADPRGPHVSEEWRAAMPAQAAGEPESVATIRSQLESLETDPLLNREGLVLRDSAAEVAALVDAPGAAFGDLPVVVLQAALTPTSLSAGLPADLGTAFAEAWRAGQQGLADESTAGSLVVVPDVDHDFPWEQPEVVVDTVESLLADLGEAG